MDSDFKALLSVHEQPWTLDTFPQRGLIKYIKIGKSLELDWECFSGDQAAALVKATLRQHTVAVQVWHEDVV